jgi:hypothetical protein
MDAGKFFFANNGCQKVTYHDISDHVGEVEFKTGNSIRLLCAYAPYAKILYFCVLKNSNEKFHMYIFIIHMRS